MLDKILTAIKALGASAYAIDNVKTESIELFYVKRREDMRRAKEIEVYKVTLYVDEDGKRGSSVTEIGLGDPDEDIIEKLEDTMVSARAALNPYFELPEAEKATCDLPSTSLIEEATKILESTFEAKDEKAFVNSLEVFATRERIHRITSVGADITYYRQSVSGEYVAQCKEPEDVEIYENFKYARADKKTHMEKVSNTLRSVRERAIATASVKTGEYDLIIDDANLSALISDFYLERLNAADIYAGYSDVKIGQNVQGDDVEGERLDITLKATAPFDIEGVRISSLSLIKNGVAIAYHGSNRYCRYLGLRPTGIYGSLELNNGSMSLREMLTDGCVYVKRFSDLQIDPFSGTFGGEIRLGYLYKNGEAIPFAGGSVGGSILSAGKNMIFSKERCERYEYSGPLAIKLFNISLSGEK